MSQSSKSNSPASSSSLFGPPVEITPRWIRVQFAGEMIADSKQALLLRQYAPGRLPTYYFPPSDVRMDVLTSTGQPDQAGGMAYWGVLVGDHLAERAAWTYLEPPPDLAALKNYISFEWNQMEAWYEEEEEIFVHARDPYKRIDTLPSSRHVRVVVGGETVADSQRAHLLFETNLPTRYYIPQEDVCMERLEATDLTTRCPYKGIASYWSVKVGDEVWQNIVWGYPNPIAECPQIKDLLCFFNERVDIYIDGVLQERPQTPWS